MPNDSARACITCNGTVVPGTSKNPSYHDACNPRPEARKEADHKRWVEDKATRHLYNGAEWKRLRLWVIQTKNPICNICHRNPSTVADHINDHKGNPQLFYSIHNLQGLCKSCHDKKTGHTPHTEAAPQKNSLYINGVEYPLAGAPPPTPVDAPTVVATSPSAPPLIPVRPEHASLPDGRVALKAEYSRWYVKRGSRWFILPPTFDRERDSENDILKQS